MSINSGFRFMILSVASLAIAAMFSPFAAAGSGQKHGSETKGRAYYRQMCKDCHSKGAKGGEIAPLSKSQAQWRSYLQKGKHGNGSELLTKFMDETKLLDVQTFLINHAADSPQPETCGK
jgi:hypothetical protein